MAQMDIRKSSPAWNSQAAPNGTARSQTQAETELGEPISLPKVPLGSESAFSSQQSVGNKTNMPSSVTWNNLSASESAIPNRAQKRHSTLSEQYWTEALRSDMFVELQLLLLSFSTGIQDAICFPDFHGFASNQTGNTVLLAVGIAGHGGSLFHLTNVALSLAAFLAGAIVTGQIGNHIGSRRRAWQFLTNLLQTAMIFAAASIQFVKGVHESGPWAHLALGLLAASSGSQVASARAFRLTEISTAMATAAWVDFVIDTDFLARKNRSRDRRAAFLLALIAGSFAGAFMQGRIGSALALAISGAGKLLVCILVLFTRAQAANMK